MIRTKYLLIAICVCIGVIVLAGIWSATQATDSVGVPIGGEAILSAPDSGYTVITQDSVSNTHEREAFISRIRTALMNEPIVDEPVVMEAVMTHESTPMTLDTVAVTTTPSTTATQTQSESPQLAP